MKTMTPITLAFDTSTKWLTLALGNRKNIIFQCQYQVQENHSRVLIKCLEWMKQEDFFFTYPPERVVVGLGPGSFTGVKIANMTARSIAYSLNCPLVGFSTLEMLATRIPEEYIHHSEGVILPVIAHKKNEIFWSELSVDFRYHVSSKPIIEVNSPSEFVRQYSGREVCVITPWIELYHYFQEQHLRCYPYEQSLPDALGLIELMEIQEQYILQKINRNLIGIAEPLYGSRVFEFK
jgi:tRNA threonylcarbamoyl adenosine modification protein YeaZ